LLPLIKPLEYSSPFAPTMYSTGLYAAPGEVVVVEIPRELAGKVNAKIGCHSDSLNEWVAAKENWRRMPLVVNSRPLEQERTEISNPFGGLIYITCPPTTDAWQGDVKISGAVMSPQFVLGRTSALEWKQMLETTGAPWGEMGTDNIILALPVPVLKKISDPENRMKIWDKIIGATMELAQLPLPFYRAQRLVTDVHMGGGFMHSGYPIMVHHCPEVGLNTEDFISDPARFSQPANGGPNWGFFHEIGHNMQNLGWVFDGTTEVSVNLFSLYCFDNVCGGRDAAHPGVSNEATQRMMNDFFAKPADFNKWKADPFLGLLTFRLIQNDFGWELFKKTFRRYHALRDTDRPKDDQQKRDFLVRCLSESAERDFAPYFSAWGIPLSPALKDELKKYPQWFPYDFPASIPRTGTWDTKTLGNHRALVEVTSPEGAVWASIPWRRRDLEPEKKGLVVIEEKSGRRVTNVLPVDLRSDVGDIVFEAATPGIYSVYYLPFVSQGESYPKTVYAAAEPTADPAWLTSHNLAAGRQPLCDRSDIARATFVGIQSIDEFNAFTEMEKAASPAERADFLATHAGKQFLVFPEDRANPIRMTDQLPAKWISEGPKSTFSGQASRGEFYAFQLGIFPTTADITDVAVVFSDLKGKDEKEVIPACALRCINSGGINWHGVAFKKTINVAKGKVQPLWCGVQIPVATARGSYRGTVRIKPVGMAEQSIDLTIAVTQKRLANAGDDEPWRHSRLRWLDSTLALDDEPVQPFLPVRLSGDSLDILGRRMVLGPSGLPAQVLSFFSPEVTKIDKSSRPLLAAPLQIVVIDAAGERLTWTAGTRKITSPKDGMVAWNTSSTAGPLNANVSGSLEFDGFSQFKVTLSAAADTSVGDIQLEIPLMRETAKYMMGLNRKGGFRPATLDWMWDASKNQDSAWLGDVNAGLQFKLKGENYVRPLLTNFYGDQPLNMPPAWFNGGKGGITIREVNDSTVLITCYSGPRTLAAGDKLHFDFDLLLTPFRPLNLRAQWSTRYFHSYQPVDEVLKSGANTINIHHGNEANPYINYPFLHIREMKDYIREAHENGLKVKIYYTIRELSNHAVELFALRSLGDEIFPHGPGGGHPWLQEHLALDYIPAWCVPRWQDAAIINKGTSRWANYYVNGFDWLVKNIGIDGLYLDDLAFDRTTMKRIRKVLDRGAPGALIDFHSANLYNPRDGFSNCANVYLEHFPYLDRLWFGEYFDYDAPPDFWLIELTGIPFGLMGEMLQDGGNKWRGLIYGMTNRMPYQGNDPSPIWKAWDEFQIQDREMIGYWSPRCPVRLDRKDVVATAYVGSKTCLIALASWADSDAEVRLSLDWAALGMDRDHAKLSAPPIAGFQPAAEFDPQSPIPVPRGKGWLLLLGPQ
jgi:hypothetical protein